MLWIFKVARRVVKKLDLFSSIQLLRYQGDAQTKTVTGGFVSLMIFVYLAVTFSSMIIDTFDKVIITSVTDTSHADVPTPLYLSTENNASQFMLGVQVFGFDLNTGPRYFDVILRNSYMRLAVVSNDSVSYALQPCTKTHWQYLPDIDTLYESVDMKKWLCMPVNVSAVLKGTYSSDLQTTLDVVLKKCNNATDPSRLCAPQDEIDAFLAANSPFYFTPYFYNPLLNPQTQNYLSTYLQTKYYIIFGDGFGSEMYIYTADYLITTDESILPFSSDHSSSGPIVSFISKNSYNMGTSTDVFAFISYFRAPESIVINRGFQKAVDVFAYIGGLLGAFLMIFIAINFYNQCSYEMNIASSLYKPEKGCLTKTAKFNIIDYFMTGVYNLFKMMKINCERWKSTEFFYETREEIQRQLDVKYLFKKLTILQNSIMLLLSKPQLKGIMLQHKMTISEAKKTRHIYTIKKRLKKYLKQNLKSQDISEQLQRGLENSLDISRAEQNLDYPRNKNMSQTIINHIDNQNQTNLRDNDEPKPKQLNLYSDSQQSSSESDEEEDTAEQFEKIFDDLNELREQSKQDNLISKRILRNLDPFIKKIYETKRRTGAGTFYELRDVSMEQVVENFETKDTNIQKLDAKQIFKDENGAAE